MYKSESESGVDGRVLFVPQDRTLVGGSSINAMIYIRGPSHRLRHLAPPWMHLLEL